MVKTRKSGILAFVLINIVALSCDNYNKQVITEGDAKLQYSAPENYVTVSQLEIQPFKVQLISNGKLSATNKAVLCFEQGGIVKSIKVKNGQLVQRSATIAELDSRFAELSHNAASLAMNKAELDLYDALAGQGCATRDTALVPKEILNVAKIRSGFLSARNNMAKADYDLSATSLKAPFSGRIADLRLTNNNMVKQGEPICSLINDDSFNVEFAIMESDYSLIVPGLSVMVFPFGNHSSTLSGRITSINPSVGKNGQIAVWAKVLNDGTLLDGMNVKVIIEKTIGEHFVVPRSAIVIRDNLDVLFRYNDGMAEWVYVNILSENSTSFAVEANKERGASLNEGDTIIISGNLNLADGSEVILKPNIN